MKSRYQFSLTLLTLLLFIQRIHAQDNPGFMFNLEDHVCKEASAAQRILDFSANPWAHQTDMVYQDVHWTVDPNVRYITGDITYYFKSLEDGLDTLILDFSDGMQINNVLRNGDPLTYTYASNLLKIHLGKFLESGASDTIRILYEGNPPTGNGFGSFEQDDHAGSPIIWTLSEPYGARDWWPVKQDLIDKIDSMDIRITTPLGQLAASNGKLISITEDNGSLIHHWRHRYPIVNYLVALAVTNYASYSQYVHLPAGDSIEILNYVYPESLNSVMTATQVSVDVMPLYNELFGLYPFASEKYGHAQFGWGGGEEHQTMSFMGSFNFDLQAHEMAHQWFGNRVTCGSWTDIWLNEGFATYLNGLAYERFSPDIFWPAWKISKVNNVTSQPGGSVYVPDTTNVGRIFNGRLSYNKGSYLLHMLRWVTGDTSFFRACRQYLESPGTSFDFGRTYELQQHLEQESGKDLDEFFNDWFYGEGHPTYHLRWTREADSLVVWLGQDQSHPSVSFFEMPVPVLAVLNGEDVILRAEHLYEDQRFSFFVGDASIDSIGIDPDLWLLSRNNTIEEVITSVIDHEDQSHILFPNPAKAQIQFLPADLSHIIITELTGAVKRLDLINGSADITGFAPGIYTVLLYGNGETLLGRKRLVIIP